MPRRLYYNRRSTLVCEPCAEEILTERATRKGRTQTAPVKRRAKWGILDVIIHGQGPTHAEIEIIDPDARNLRRLRRVPLNSLRVMGEI